VTAQRWALPGERRTIPRFSMAGMATSGPFSS